VGHYFYNVANNRPFRNVLRATKPLTRWDASSVLFDRAPCLESHNIAREPPFYVPIYFSSLKLVLCQLHPDNLADCLPLSLNSRRDPHSKWWPENLCWSRAPMPELSASIRLCSAVGMFITFIRNRCFTMWLRQLSNHNDRTREWKSRSRYFPHQ